MPGTKLEPPPPAPGVASRRGLLVGAAAIVIATALLAFYFLGGKDSGQKAVPPATTAKGPEATAKPRYDMGYPPLPPPAAGELTAPLPSSGPAAACGETCFCADGSQPCQAHRACASGPCGGLLEKRAWRLRLGGLMLKDQTDIDSDTTVCFNATGAREQVCTTLREVRGASCASGTGIHVTTDQIISTGLDIDVRVPGASGKLIGRAAGAAYKFVTNREMCNGIRFGGPKFSGGQVQQVSFYLDDI